MSSNYWKTWWKKESSLPPKTQTSVKNSHLKSVDSLSLSSINLGALVKSVVEAGQGIQFRAKGNSMFPTIKDGDLIKITQYTEISPNTGDVVAYLDHNTRNLIIHRIVDLTSDIFFAKGDSCFRKDPPQPINTIIGYISAINHRENILWGINHRVCKKYYTFFSKIGIIPSIAYILKS